MCAPTLWPSVGSTLKNWFRLQLIKALMSITHKEENSQESAGLNSSQALLRHSVALAVSHCVWTPQADWRQLEDFAAGVPLVRPQPRGIHPAAGVPTHTGQLLHQTHWQGVSEVGSVFQKSTTDCTSDVCGSRSMLQRHNTRGPYDKLSLAVNSCKKYKIYYSLLPF